MLSKFNTKTVIPGLFALLVLVTSFILPQSAAVFSGIANTVSVEQADYPTVSPDDVSKSVIDASGRDVDLHARILCKIKIKNLIKKDQLVQALNEFYPPTSLISSPRLLTRWVSFTKPAYYLFLFRYTLF